MLTACDYVIPQRGIRIKKNCDRLFDATLNSKPKRYWATSVEPLYPSNLRIRPFQHVNGIVKRFKCSTQFCVHTPAISHTTVENGWVKPTTTPPLYIILRVPVQDWFNFNFFYADIVILSLNARSLLAGSLRTRFASVVL